MSLNGNSTAEKIFNFCKSKGMNDFGASAVVANIDAECGLKYINIQDTGNRKLGMTDEQYVAAVDNGSYTKEQFVYDQIGVFIVQWTYWSRKKALYEFWKSYGGSIGNLEMMLEFMFLEISTNYKSLLNTLKTASSIEEATNAFLLQYERPYDMGTATQNLRAGYARKYYTQFVTNRHKNEMEGVSNMGYIQCAKGKNTKLSDHFNSYEFDCHGKGCCSLTIINEQLVVYLEKIRVHFNAPITITSAYRCPIHNKNVGGATGSRHSKGDAADIVVKGVAPRKVAQYAESIGIKGIGLYETAADGYFVHIDTRSTKSFWYGQAQQYRSTFGIYINNTSGNSTNTTVNSITVNTILNVGDKGEAVKQLQIKLNRLGCDCGEADGSFGNKTRIAVRKFQAEYGDGKLAVDGIAGYHTLTAIDKAIAELDSTEHKIRVTANVLNVRSGAGINNPVVGGVRKGATFTLVEEKNGWGKIKNPTGWISLQYTEKV